MSMGYGSVFVDAIEVDALESICKDAYNKLIDALLEGTEYVDEYCDADMQSFAKDIEYHEVGEDRPEYAAYQNLIDAFEKETNLTMGLGFHDQDETGDRYDDIDGAFFWIDGMYDLTPAGKALKDRCGEDVGRKFFVQFG